MCSKIIQVAFDVCSQNERDQRNQGCRCLLPVCLWVRDSPTCLELRALLLNANVSNHGGQCDNVDV